MLALLLTFTHIPCLSYVLLAIQTTSVTAAQHGCLGTVFGSPDPKDCSELLDSIADYNDGEPRLFDEEQLRTDERWSFPGVKNQYSANVVQIPAFWSLSKYSSCRPIF